MITAAEYAAEMASRRDSNGTLILPGDRVRIPAQQPHVGAYRVLRVSNGVATLATGRGGSSFDVPAASLVIVDQAS